MTEFAFAFEKIITEPARKYVQITIEDWYSYITPVFDEYTFDIENKENAYRIIKDFIVNKENSPELVFEVGYCQHCVKWLDVPDACCKHRLASFKYDADYTLITGYSDRTYKIKIIL